MLKHVKQNIFRNNFILNIPSAFDLGKMYFQMHFLKIILSFTGCET